MKKLGMLGLMMLMAIAFAFSANAETYCNLSHPISNMYDDGDNNLRFNVTFYWESLTVNGTNVTFTVGSSVFSNTTMNGTRTNTRQGDFTFTVPSSSLTEGALTAYATCYNETEESNANVAKNSSSVTYTVDLSNPQVKLSVPVSGSYVIPDAQNFVTFEYTPTDTNFGNCSLHLNNQNSKSTTSGTTSSNFTSARLQRFTQKFPADNSSVRVAVQCTDLSGRKGTSSNFTFGVLASGLSPALKEKQSSKFSSVPSPAAGNAFKYSPPSGNTHLQQWGWLYAVAAIVIAVIIVRKKFK